MKDTTVDYFDVLRRNMQKTILDDIPTFLKMKTDTLSKLEKMFYFIAKTPPSDFTYTWLSQKIWLSKDVLESIMVYLHKIGVVNLLIRSNKLSDIMRKEFKVLLWNPNMYYAYGVHKDKGALRESFVIHSLRKIQQQQILPDYMTLPSYGDIAFKWQDKYYTFEIWWRSKWRKQIEGVANSFVVTDEMMPAPGRIPLWMFGLLE